MLGRTPRPAVAPTAAVPVHQPGRRLPMLPIPAMPRAAPPYLPAGRHGHSPPRAGPAPPRAAASPEAPWRRLPRPTPLRELALTGGDACGTDRAAPGLPELCHAPDPPGGDGRRKRGGGGSSSRAAPAPARGGRAAGAGLGDEAGRAGSAWKARQHRDEELGGLIPELQRLCLGCGVQRGLTAGAGQRAEHPRPWDTEQWMCRGANRH